MCLTLFLLSLFLLLSLQLVLPSQSLGGIVLLLFPFLSSFLSSFLGLLLFFLSSGLDTGLLLILCFAFLGSFFFHSFSSLIGEGHPLFFNTDDSLFGLKSDSLGLSSSFLGSGSLVCLLSLVGGGSSLLLSPMGSFSGSSLLLR